MRKSALKTHHLTLDAALTRYKTFASKIINAQGVTGTAEAMRDLFESLTLGVIAHWEGFIDEHLVACVSRNCQLQTLETERIPRRHSCGSSEHEPLPCAYF